MAYERCADVSGEIWAELKARDPQEIVGRTGSEFKDGLYRLPFLNRELFIDPKGRRGWVAGAPDRDPGFRACLTALLYLLRLDPATLGPPISPMELPGGATFFRGYHVLPQGPLEERFGQDLAAFWRAGQHLYAEVRPAGDGALALRVFPGLAVEVILWRGDEEFAAQVSFTVPSHLDRFWNLDAVWGLLNLAAQELLAAA